MNTPKLNTFQLLASLMHNTKYIKQTKQRIKNEKGSTVIGMEPTVTGT